MAGNARREPIRRFRAELWRHDGDAAWYFVTLPFDLADDVEERHGRSAGGFGSVRVRVRIGSTEWSTSLFPDTKRRSYVLPVKKAVRVAEGLDDGSTVDVELEVVAGAADADADADADAE